MLLCRVGHLICSFPLTHTEETMRPLPVDAVAGAPPYVQGVALIRGVPVPVVDPSFLLHGRAASAVTRFVTVKTGNRRVALTVDRVIGVARVTSEQLMALPPLLGELPRDLVTGIGVLDASLLLVLDSARLVPDDVWTTIGARGGNA